MEIRGVEIVEREQWSGLARFDTNIGEVRVGVGVPEHLQATADAAGTDRGLLDVWPGGGSLEDWAPPSVSTPEQADALLRACRGAALRAWSERDVDEE